VHRGPKILLPGAGFLITGTKPVPLQAGHISSATSDLIGFIRHAAPAQSTRAIDYIFLKLRNQLRRVTLNNKVKLNHALLVLASN
jgi:hypothetical protein